MAQPVTPCSANPCVYFFSAVTELGAVLYCA